MQPGIDYMQPKPLISIILTFYNRREVIEPALTTLFELENLPFELYVIDDASDDNSAEVIQSVLDYYGHDHTYFYEYPETRGRGTALNEALQQCSSSLVWFPYNVESVNEDDFITAIRELKDSKFSALFQGNTYPTTIEQWMELVQSDDWPDDGLFIWNLENIPPEQQFFNPYLYNYQGIELAARLGDPRKMALTDTLYESPDTGRAPKPSESDKGEMAFTLLRNVEPGEDFRRDLFNLLEKEARSAAEDERQFEEEELKQAFQLKEKGKFNDALELIEQFLEEQPAHPGAKQLKVEVLERKRRFVEASELKHEIQTARPSPEEIKTSIIIPTAVFGKPALEHCLLSLNKYCSRDDKELIIIDNASLDDTHEYLEQLKKNRFFHCTVITNEQNKGFAASINQGLEAAEGEYACVMHNDVELQEDALSHLEDLMDLHTGYAVIGPLATKTLNPDQAARNYNESSERLLKAEYLDSFCMMIRTDTGLLMDETYELAFFEDIDLCFQARKKGFNVGIATGTVLKHHYGTTTFSLDLDTESTQYWKNVAYFNEKWGIDVYSEEELKSKSTFDQLLALDELVNPLYPEKAIKEWFNRLFTDELKTEIMKTEHDPETLCKLVHLMMVMNKRDIMRRLEDRLENIELPASLIHQLVRFYFKRNIYSRCRHYLDQLQPDQQSLQSELYALEILVDEKDLEDAIPKLKELLDKAPAHPTLYRLAGNIHQFEGNEEEAESFYNIARQINPFEETDDKVKDTLL